MTDIFRTPKPVATPGTEPTNRAAPPAADLAYLALLPKRDVLKLIGRSASCLHQLVRAGLFPQPLRYGTRCTRWQAGQVRAWLIDQVEAGDQRDLSDAQVKARVVKASAAAQTPAARAKAKATRDANIAARAGSATIQTGV